MGRPAAMTKLGAKRIHVVRTRGGNSKFRALRLETGNFAWSSETTTRKTRVVDVVYNATSNELVRTKTLVKGSIIQIDATPFRQYYEAHYGLPLGKKKQESKKKEDKAAKKDTKKSEGEAAKAEDPLNKKKSRHVTKKIAARKESSKVDPQLLDQFSTGRLYGIFLFNSYYYFIYIFILILILL